MIETEIITSEKPKLKNPICVVGLPGIGHIGRIAVDYLVHELKAKKFAELYSPFFFPFVIIHEDKIHTLRNEFFYYKNPRGRDLILLIGDSQTYDPKGHYEVSGKIVDYVKGLGCKEIITIGGFSTGRVTEKPKVFGVVCEDGQSKELAKYGVEMKVSGQIGTIVGAAGLIAGIGNLRGLKTYTLLGETSGFPIVTDPNAAGAVLETLQKILGIKVDLGKLKEKVEQMHEFIKKLSELQSQAMESMQKSKKPEDLKYIG
ncbi:MAG: proteasome assembly chaperone family protein [Candidatus Aenigmatarchaeota archaeon]